MKWRRLREIGVVTIVVAIVAGVVVAAVQADGRRSVRTETNDGGAWLINREQGLTGHVNRTAAEVSGVTKVADENDVFDVEQADETIVSFDATVGLVSTVDPRTFQVINDVETPRNVHVLARPTGAVVWQSQPLRVWDIDRQDLISVKKLTEIPITHQAKGAGLVTVTRDDTLLVVDAAGDQLLRYAPGESEPQTVPLAGLGESTTQLSAIGDDAVLLTDSGIVVIPADASGEDDVNTASSAAIDVGETSGIAHLAQPAFEGEPVVAVRQDGTVLSTSPGDADQTEEGEGPVADEVTDELTTDPIAPIAYDGCIFAVGTKTPLFLRICDGEVDQRQALSGVSADSLRMRLINGYVWINDLDSGAAWVTGSTQDLDRIDDWGNALGETADEPSEQKGQKNDGDEKENPDIGEIRPDEIDEDGKNDPPIAQPDRARTRVDRPVVVDVLRNDQDADGDAMMITKVDGAPEGVMVSTTPDRTQVQVTPRPGDTTPISFEYTITDGRGGTDSAKVDVEVTPADAANRPPATEKDIAEVRGGASASFNVLRNDVDPDGDPLVLEAVKEPSGRVIFDPSGEITFTPDPNSSAGTIELEYRVVDSFGADAKGIARVAIRLDTSNNEPDARNDTYTTVVGKPATFNVMTNDTDADNDPLSIAGLPELVAPAGNSTALDEISLTNDGEFFFLPSKPGDYVFKYAVIDGSEQDAAYIRVNVDEAEQNRPPVAIRDDVTIGRGASRNVYVLPNDTDPDGDVVGITSWTKTDGLEIEQIQGSGFRVTVEPDAPDQAQFRYSISDGKNDPVSGVVVVAVSNADPINQPPVARPDVIEVRPGATTSVQSLTNDYDPEGGPLRIVNVSDARGAQLRIGPGGQEIFISPSRSLINGFSFGYDVADEAGNVTGSLVEVRLVPPDEANRPPVARPDIHRTTAGQAVKMRVLDNDSDPDGDAIQLESISAQPAFGMAEIDPRDGTVVYTPDRSYAGSDRLRYTIVDASGARHIGEVVIGVMPSDGENLPPTAADDSYSVIAGSDPILMSVRDNDFDANGDALSITDVVGNQKLVSLPRAGDVIVFKPPRSLPQNTTNQEFTFKYTLDDARGGTDTGLITVEVRSVAKPVAPVAVDDLIGPIAEGDPVEFDLLANDVDPDGARAQLTVSTRTNTVDISRRGVLTIDETRRTVEVPYTITDPDGLTSTGLATVVVVKNMAPETEALETETKFETPLVVDVDRQVTDPDGDTLHYVCCYAERGGRTEILDKRADSMRVRFVPDDSYDGPAGFAYRADDQNGHQVQGAVRITVKPQENRPPVAQSRTVEVEAGRTGTVSLDDLVRDPDEASGDRLRFGLGDTGNAPVTLSGSTVKVAPPIEAAGETYEFDYRATDRAGKDDDATITVRVTESTIEPPTAASDSARTMQGQPVTLNVLQNDLDPLGEGLTIVAAGTSDGSGSVSHAGNDLTFTPNESFFGEATLTYRIQDARASAAGEAVGSVSITVIGRPGTPTTPQATAGNAVASITWGLPPTNGADITQIELQANTGDTVTLSPTSSHTIDGLTNGQAYQFRVRAQNEAGWGEWSGYSEPVTPDIEPGRPSAPTIQFADQQLIVRWSEPPNEGSAITSYQLEIGGGMSGTQTLGNNTEFTWTGLTNGTNYQFRVQAINAKGGSDWSSWSEPEHPLRQPDAPASVAAERQNQALDVVWSSANPNGDPVIEYQIEMRSQPGNYQPTSSNEPYTWSNLQNGVEQQFRVRAFNRDPDPGAWSSWSAPVKPCGVPDTPSAPSAVDQEDQKSTVSWTAPDDQGCGIDTYEVRIAGTSTTQGASSTSHVFAPLTNGQSYRFEIRAHNEEGWGDWSGASNTVVPAGPPIGPSSISAAATTEPGTVHLEWSTADGNGRAVQNYNISVNDGPPENVGNVTSYNRTGLANAQTYTFKVQACNAVGCGDWSSSATATTAGPPAQIGTPSFSMNSSRQGTASWSAPSDSGSPITGYNVELSPGGTTSTTSTGYTWSDLEYDTDYQARVQACNAVGCGAWSAWSASDSTPSPQPDPSATASKGASAQGESGCSSSYCAFVHLEMNDFTPNQDYTVRCWSSRDGYWSSPETVHTDGSGHLSQDLSCYYGYPDNQVRVEGSSWQTNTFTW